MVFSIKIHPVSSLVVFPQYYCFYLFQNLLIPQQKKTEKTDKVNYCFKKKKNQFQARWNSKQNISKEEGGMNVI